MVRAYASQGEFDISGITVAVGDKSLSLMKLFLELVSFHQEGWSRQELRA